MNTPSIPYFSSPLIHTPHAFFTRKGGKSLPPRKGLNASLFVHDNQKHVLANRHILAQQLHIDTQQILFAHQVHSSRVSIIRRHQPWHPHPLYTPRADALVTNLSLLALGVTTADCVPILLFDPKNRVIAAIHGGWRGLLTGIIKNTINAMITLKASPPSIRAAIGPCISLHSYPVGPLLLSNLNHTTKTFTSLFHNQHHLNLTALSQFLLIQENILPLHISTHAHRDTFSYPHTFFSSRYAQKYAKNHAPPVYGCQASLILLHQT